MIRFALGLSLAFLGVTQAAAAVINVTDDAYHFVDRVGTNSFTSDSGLYLTFGVVGVSPNTPGGTTGTYQQGAESGDLFDVSSTVRNEYAARVDYDLTLTGSWELTFTNESDTVVLNTPTVGSAVPPSFVTDVAQTGTGLTPTFTWMPPADAERIQIYIRDLTSTGPSGGVSADLIFIQEAVGNSFTVPDGLLVEGGVYSIQIQGDTFREDGSLLGRSRVFYDFTTGPLPDTGGAPIFLPTTDTTSGTPVFNFDNAVVKGALAYYDPMVAVGYDYAIGDGDPLFASVVLPNIGDGFFDLFFPNLSGGFDFVAQLKAGEIFSFGDGVEAFRILGIEVSAGLDPTDPTAFVTGLSFVSDGRFTGTMTPIIEDVEVVPLPASFSFLLAGVGAIAISARRSRLKSKAKA